MKKIISIGFMAIALMILFCPNEGMSQTAISSTEELNSNQVQWLMKSGFNARKYNWNNEDVNYHLNLALDYQKNAPAIKWAGVGAAVAGSILMVWGYSEMAAYGEKGGVAAMGTVLFLGGTVAWIIGGKRSAEARYNLDKAINLNAQTP